MYTVTANAISVKELRDLQYKLNADLFNGVEFETCDAANRFINLCLEIVPYAEYWIEQN